MRDVIGEFDSLCERAEYAFGRQEELSFESALIDILNFIKLHADHRLEFVGRFKLILDVKAAPFEAVAFCMRELQWEDIRDYAVSIWKSSVDPRDQALRSLLTAYDEVWPDADLYEYYGG